MLDYFNEVLNSCQDPLLAILMLAAVLLQKRVFLFIVVRHLNWFLLMMIKS